MATVMKQQDSGLRELLEQATLAEAECREARARLDGILRDINRAVDAEASLPRTVLPPRNSIPTSAPASKKRSGSVDVDAVLSVMADLGGQNLAPSAIAEKLGVEKIPQNLVAALVNGKLIKRKGKGRASVWTIAAKGSAANAAPTSAPASKKRSGTLDVDAVLSTMMDLGGENLAPSAIAEKLGVEKIPQNLVATLVNGKLIKRKGKGRASVWTIAAKGSAAASTAKATAAPAKEGAAADGNEISLKKAIWLALDREKWPMLKLPESADGDLTVGEIYDVIVHDKLWKSGKNEKFTNQISTEIQKLRKEGKVARGENLRYYVVKGATFDGPSLDEDGKPIK
jgi:hypothetical protein